MRNVFCVAEQSLNQNSSESFIDGSCTLDARDDLARILKSLGEYGAVKLRNCIAPSLLAGINAVAQIIYRERQVTAAEGKMPGHMAAYYARRTIPLKEIVVDGTQAEDILIRDIFREIARAHVGHEPAPAHDNFVREMIPGPGDARLPFHQDQAILQTKLLNVWIPLTPCGVDAPGLEVVRTSERKLLVVAPPDHPKFAVERARIDEALVLATFGRSALWHPVFEIGDAMLFFGATVHRTYITSEMTRPRKSAEIRLL